MTDSAFDTPQYRRVMAACKERDKIPTQAWTPDEEDNPEEFMEDVYKKELGNSFEKIEGGIAVGNSLFFSIDFTKDSEYIRLYGSKD